jgi:YD repeat-containing protein
MNINKLKDIYAIRMQGCSLVGIDTSSLPVSFGNYFSVLCSDGKCREIANMWQENFEDIIEKEKIKDENRNFEVGIKVLDSKWALIHDKRFPNNYYTEDLSYRVPTNKLKIIEEIDISEWAKYDEKGNLISFHYLNKNQYWEYNEKNQVVSYRNDNGTAYYSYTYDKNNNLSCYKFVGNI